MLGQRRGHYWSTSDISEILYTHKYAAAIDAGSLAQTQHDLRICLHCNGIVDTYH